MAVAYKHINLFIINFVKAEQKLYPEYEDIFEIMLEDWENKEFDFKKVLTRVIPKKEKPKRPKDAPKRNKSAYMFFCADERKNVKKERPDIVGKFILGEVGVRWKNLKETNPERYAKYDKLAREDKIRYEKEMKIYNKTTDSNSDDSESDSEYEEEPILPVIEPITEPEPKKIEPEVSKTKLSKFDNFFKIKQEDVKKNNPKIKPKQLKEILSNKWKKMTEEEKNKF